MYNIDPYIIEIQYDIMHECMMHNMVYNLYIIIEVDDKIIICFILFVKQLIS